MTQSWLFCSESITYTKVRFSRNGSYGQILLVNQNIQSDSKANDSYKPIIFSDSKAYKHEKWSLISEQNICMGQYFLGNQNIRDFWNLIPEQLTLISRFGF